MDDVVCKERMALERKVVEIVRALYGAKGQDRQPARVAERKAVRELEEHIKEHGCKPADF